MKILIIEDDPAIIETISFVFQAGWPEAKIVATKRGQEGLETIEKESPQLIILDLGLPDISGFDVLKKIRLFSEIPVVILTVRSEEENIIKGLEMGADEYIVKPFRPLELIARSKKALRSRHFSLNEKYLESGCLRLDIYERKLHIGENIIELTNTETIIVSQLIKKAGEVVSRQALAEALWGCPYPGYTKAIRVYISQIRNKVNKYYPDASFIITYPRTGYMITEANPA